MFSAKLLSSRMRDAARGILPIFGDTSNFVFVFAYAIARSYSDVPVRGRDLCSRAPSTAEYEPFGARWFRCVDMAGGT